MSPNGADSRRGRSGGRESGASEQLELFPRHKYLTVDQLAALIGVPKSFIYRRTCRGHDDPIPAYRFGGHLRFRLDEIEEWITSHQVIHESLSQVSETPVRRAVAATRTNRSGQRLRRGAKSVKSRSR
jgi:excisionase family DNA binding protein